MYKTHNPNSIKATIRSIVAGVCFSSTAYATPIDTIIQHVKIDLNIQESNSYYSKSTQTLYFMSNEERALINCYKYKMAIHFDDDTVFVSALSSFEVVPISEKLQPNDFGKRSMKKIQLKIKSSIDSISKGMVFHFDDDKNDDPLDYLSHRLYRQTGYGAKIDVVRKPIVEPWIRYESYWHTFKNGLGNHPNLDTIPVGGIAIIDDFYCGFKDEHRMFDVFFILPEFANLKDVVSTKFIRAKVSMLKRPNVTNMCGNYYTYFLAINSPIPDTARIVIMGKFDISHESQICDWRIISNSRDSTIQIKSWKTTP